MAQWLAKLKTNTKSTEHPLTIRHILYDNRSGIGNVEVALSYQLIKRHDFFGRRGAFSLRVNGSYQTTACLPATNGNCFLLFDYSKLNQGTNHIQVYFMIINPSNLDFPLNATGPVAELVLSNSNQRP